MEKSGGMDPPPPYNYEPPPGGVPQPMQPAYGAGGVPPPQPGAYPPPMGGPMPGAPMPGPPGQYHQQPPPITTVVVAQQIPVFGAHPIQISCMRCGAQIVTETKVVAGLLTWLICGALALIGCWVGCCLIPFCVDDCQDVEHWCPNCKSQLGTYKRLG